MTGKPNRIATGQTTLPSDTSPARSDGHALGIRWLSPALDGRVTWTVGNRTLFGRGEDCDGQLPGSETSRHHAEVIHHGPLAIIRDLGSRNGVFVNAARVAEAALSVGDVIRLGEWVGLVIRAPSETTGEEFRFRTERGLVAGPVLAPTLEIAKRGAQTDLPLVIQGETGTGKELVAGAVHAWSGRSGAFVAINCAALPEPLAEAELFGYKKGAFTGAERASPGHFRTAHQGTLFLDEISDLSLPLQAKLLRALEQREVIPVGESTPVKVDVRVVAATQSPLRQLVREQRFRPDLQARLDGVTILLPPLRSRIEEVPYLFDWFLHKHSGGEPPPVEPRLIEELCLYEWPSNVRELELLARRLVGLFADQPRLKRAHLPEHMLARGQKAADPVDGHGAEEARDLARLVEALRLFGGNVSRAAAQAGISRQRAYRLLESHPELDLDGLRQALRGSPEPASPKGRGSG